ncbi:pimeloyl-ACP methyl ester carboxylesterase [Paraburkholderia atlantica]
MIESRDLASACGGTPMTPYINTEYTARDMEVIRAALGYDKLNYYGTALGARYASLFPGRTGRLVLDSVVDITLPFAEVGPQAPAFQRTFDGIIAPYVAAQNELFGLGSNADDVKEITRNGPLGSQVGLAEPFDSLYAQWQIDAVVEKLAVAKRIERVLAENPQISPNDLHREVVSLPFFPSWNRAVENATQKIAGEAVARYAEVVSGSTRSLEDPEAAQVSVICNDGALIHSSEEYWADHGNSLAMSAPLGGGGLSSGQPCLYRPFSTRRLPSFDSAATLPILMLQDEDDGPTPLPGARATAATLKNSRLVVQETTYDHGAFFSGSECIGGYFADYLLEGALPEKGATWAGNAVTEEYRTDMYTDRLEAEKVLEDLREIMR